MSSHSCPPRALIRSRRTILWALACAVGAPACGTDEPASSATPEGLDGPDRELAIETVELFGVGGFDAPDWATFGRVSSVAFDETGLLYIFDDQAAQVTVVSPEGEYVRVVGRRGDGPGELGRPMAMTVLRNGWVVVPDLGKRGLVVYDQRGEWQGNRVLDLAQEGVPSRGLRPTASGQVVSAEPLRVGAAPEANGSEPDTPGTRPVWLYPVAPGDSARRLMDAWDPPPPPEGGESRLEGSGGGGRGVMIQMTRTRAFTPELHLAPLPDGRVAVVDSVDYTIQLVGPDGQVDRLHRPVPPTPVTPELEEQERSRRLDEIVERSMGTRLQVIGGDGGLSVNPDAMRRMLEDQVAQMVFFPEIPVVEELAADWDGRLWVQRSSGVPGQDGPTDVVTPEGGYLGTIPPEGLRIPDAFGPGGLAAYIELDELEVATVRVVRLRVAS